MKFIDNAGQLWHQLYSIRFAALAAVLSGASVALTMVLPAHTSLRIAILMGLLTTASALASIAARLVKQPRLKAAAAPARPEGDPARGAALADVRLLASVFGLTAEDVFGEVDADH